MKRFLSEEEAIEELKNGSFGVMGIIDEKKPYSIPLHYISDDFGNIYVHGRPTGKRLNLIFENNNVNFVVVTYVENVPQMFSAKFTSVIVEGKARFVKDLKEKEDILNKFVEKFSSDYKLESKPVIERNLSTVSIIKITKENITARIKG